MKYIRRICAFRARFEQILRECSVDWLHLRSMNCGVISIHIVVVKSRRSIDRSVVVARMLVADPVGWDEMGWLVVRFCKQLSILSVYYSTPLRLTLFVFATLLFLDMLLRTC